MKYFKSVRMQLILAITTSLLMFLLVAMGGLFLFQRDELTKESIEKATEIGQALKAVLKGQMCTHSEEMMQTLVDEIRAFRGSTNINIINLNGVVKFSSDPAFTGQKLSKDSDGCRQCHHDVTGRNTVTVQTRNFEGASILRNVTHIYNEAACFKCHPTSEKNLGLLFVDYSTADRDALISSTLVRLFLTAVAACITISLVILSLLSQH